MRPRWATGGTALLVFAGTFSVFLASPVVQVADSRYALLLSETLLRDQSIALDRHFQPPLDPERHPNAERGRLPYQVERVNGHVYAFYPPGAAFLSVPLLAILEPFGITVTDPDGTYDPRREERAQHVVASLLMAVASVLFLLTAQQLLPSSWSALLGIAAAFATQVWSTGSRGLWSDTWGVALLAAILLLLVRADIGAADLRPVLLATLTAWMFFVRPTYAIPIVALTAHVAIRHRRRLALFLSVGLVWLVLFLAFSWSHSGRLLPLYYTSRTFTLASFLPALAGGLLSPSRGLLVCVPIVAFVVYLAGRYSARVQRGGLALVAVASIAGHLLLLAFFPLWWGGHSYGARYTFGLVPWFVLLAILGLRGRLDLARHGGAQLRTRTGWEAAAGVLLLVLSAAIQARGALSPETSKWNYAPDDVDKRQERLWDWRHPQLLAGIVPPPLRMNEPIALGAETADVFLRDGWSGREPGFRWTDGPEAGLWFDLDRADAALLRMELHAYVFPGRLDSQRVEIEVNGRRTGLVTLADHERRVRSIPLADGLLARRNRLRLLLPDAVAPARFGGRDSRNLGVAVRWIRLDRLGVALPGVPIALGRPQAAKYLGEGWSGPEDSFRWTDGARAAVFFAAAIETPATLRLRMRPYLASSRLPAQRVTVRLNGQQLAALVLDSSAPQEHAFPLAAGVLARTNTLELELPDARAPEKLGVSADRRALGVAAEWLRLDDADSWTDGPSGE